MLGAFFALRPFHVPKLLAAVLSVISLTGLVALSVLPGTSHQYYAVLTFGAPVAAVLGLAAVTGAASGAMPLGVRPLVFFGRISYGLYLWHEVILLSKPFGESLDGIWRMVGVVGALALSLVSWVLVESPFLRQKTRFEVDTGSTKTTQRADLPPRAAMY